MLKKLSFVAIGLFWLALLAVCLWPSWGLLNLAYGMCHMGLVGAIQGIGPAHMGVLVLAQLMMLGCFFYVRGLRRR